MIALEGVTRHASGPSSLFFFYAPLPELLYLLPEGRRVSSCVGGMCGTWRQLSCGLCAGRCSSREGRGVLVSSDTVFATLSISARDSGAAERVRMDQRRSCRSCRGSLVPCQPSAASSGSIAALLPRSGA